jgi:hypothetical protein
MEAAIKNAKERKRYSKRIQDPLFKEQKRKTDLEYYHKNKERLVSRQIERRKELLIEAKEKLGGCCVSCGTEDNLEFDHIDDSIKSENVGNAVRHNRDTFWNEVCKCQLMCKDCHKRRTTAQKRAKQKMWLSLSLEERNQLVSYELNIM